MTLKKVLSSTLLFFVLFVISSCYGSWNPFEANNDVDSRIENLSDISADLPSSVTQNKGEYKVLILTDLHYGSTSKDCPEKELFDWLDSLSLSERPRFAISLGDSADTGSQSEYDDYLKFCNELKSKYEIEMMNVPGNHDLYQAHWDVWKKNCFPNKSLYSFKTQNFSWYAIDTASGSIGLNQFYQLKKAIQKDPNPKIVYTHYPILEFNLVFGLCDTVERNLLIDLFVRNNVKISLGGHLHYYATDKLEDYQEYCLPSFKYDNTWSILTVDENSGAVKIDLIKR